MIFAILVAYVIEELRPFDFGARTMAQFVPCKISPHSLVTRGTGLNGHDRVTLGYPQSNGYSQPTRVTI